MVADARPDGELAAFEQVPLSHLVNVWGIVKPWLEAALKNNPRYSMKDVWGLVESGNWQMWVAVTDRIEAVCLTTLIEYPQQKWAHVIALTGRNRRAWQQQYHDTIEAWAKANGCAGVESEARKGWARIFPDYRMTHLKLEKEF